MAKGTKILSVRLSEGRAVMDFDQAEEWLKLNKKVIYWLKENSFAHPISHIADEASLNQGNLSESIRKNQISEDNLGKIVKVISKLGFRR